MFTINLHFPDRDLVCEWGWIPPLGKVIYWNAAKNCGFGEGAQRVIISEMSEDKKDIWVEYI